MQVAATSKGLSVVHPSIQKLVDSLNATEEAALLKSLKSLHTLGKNDKNRVQIFVAGAPSVLIRLCQNENRSVAENAVHCLLSLADGDEHIDSIGSLGIDVFLANVTDTHADLVINTCKLLAKLAGTPANREMIRNRGGLANLSNCLKREHEWIRLYATKALMCAYVDGDPSQLQEVLRIDGVDHVFAHYRSHIESTSI